MGNLQSLEDHGRQGMSKAELERMERRCAEAVAVGTGSPIVQHLLA